MHSAAMHIRLGRAIVEADLSRLRSILDANEVPRYRELCRDAGSVVGARGAERDPGNL